jgi:hypothetical protein
MISTSLEWFHRVGSCPSLWRLEMTNERRNPPLAHELG